jgi:Helicase conserved C-terminal domain
LYCDAGQLVPCCVDHQRFASREGDAELKPRLVQEALAEQPGQLRVTELLALRGAGGQPSQVGGELAAYLAIHPDHRRDKGESVGLVRIRGELGYTCITYNAYYKVPETVRAQPSIDVYDGKASHSRKKEILQRFKDDDVKFRPVLLLSIDSGGTGLNLQFAEVAIFCEVWWTRSLHEQAEQRIYRKGQTKRVEIYYMLAKDTIDECVYEQFHTPQAVLNRSVVAGKFNTELDSDIDSLKSSQWWREVVETDGQLKQTIEFRQQKGNSEVHGVNLTRSELD